MSFEISAVWYPDINITVRYLIRYNKNVNHFYRSKMKFGVR